MCEVESATDYTFFYYAVAGSAILIASVFTVMTMVSNVKTAELKKAQRIKEVQNKASRNNSHSDKRKRKRKERLRKEGNKNK